MLRIGLICYGLDRPLTGIGRYTVEFARALAALDEPLELHLLTAGKPGPLAGLPGARQVALPGCRLLPALLTLGSAMLPFIAKQHQLDILHDPTGVTPFAFGTAKARGVVTVHDVFPWSCPGYNSLLDNLIYRYWLPKALPIGGHTVLTVSRQSRKDIEHFLHVDSSKLHVIPYGIGPQFKQLSHDTYQDRIQSRFSLTSPYVLFVGALTERKNIGRALQAFAQISPDFPSLHFVIAGPRSWKQTPVAKIIDDLKITEKIILTGPLTDIDLPALYNGAELFIFPSLYEGFGFPPLEAMACGVPVITSNVSSLPEVTGDAAILVDPHDTQAIAGAMRRALLDSALREQMKMRGLAQAAGFTWRRTAQETLVVYRKVLAQK